MKTPLDSEIRQRVAAVLAGELALREFYRWFMPATWDIDDLDESSSYILIRDITHAFSEFSSGILSQEELRREIELAAATSASSVRHRVA